MTWRSDIKLLGKRVHEVDSGKFTLQLCQLPGGLKILQAIYVDKDGHAAELMRENGQLVMDLSPEMLDVVQVTVDQTDAVCGDSVYTMWFECPSCGSQKICDQFDYCPACGVRLRFTNAAKGWRNE